ncbi:hypothetical protein B0H13DRAFT_1928281 [Mycena leptocephala]|nr:hypothetical protein B0H13DRAFT_1928281 [Mycena leptocephala]
MYGPRRFGWLWKIGLISAVSDLPNKLETLLDEGGSFSAGQRQLLCLARVLLRRRHIVVLDEASSSLDAETERKFRDIVRTDLTECTVFAVAHRIAADSQGIETIVDFDMIIVMEDGMIAETGTPASLLSRPDSKFAAFARSQRISDRSKAQGSTDEIMDSHPFSSARGGGLLCTWPRRGSRGGGGTTLVSSERSGSRRRIMNREAALCSTEYTPHPRRSKAAGAAENEGRKTRRDCASSGVQEGKAEGVWRKSDAAIEKREGIAYTNRPSALARAQSRRIGPDENAHPSTPIHKADTVAIRWAKRHRGPPASSGVECLARGMHAPERRSELLAAGRRAPVLVTECKRASHGGNDTVLRATNVIVKCGSAVYSWRGSLMESNCAMRREVIYREFKRGNRMSMAITINPLKTGRAPTHLTPFMKRMKREGILRKATHYETDLYDQAQNSLYGSDYQRKQSSGVVLADASRLRPASGYHSQCLRLFGDFFELAAASFSATFWNLD